MTPGRRKELRFRVGFGVVGLGLVAVTALSQGFPPPATMAEVIVIGGGFFGGTAAWAAWTLWRDGDRQD